jgi:hypothetical protein
MNTTTGKEAAMIPTVTILTRETIGTVERLRLRIEDERGYCEVTKYAGTAMLASWGGSLWPNAWPDLFELRGPDGYITSRTGYAAKPRLLVLADLIHAQALAAEREAQGS